MNTTEQNKQIHKTVSGERKRLLGFIRQRVPSLHDAEDVLQEVFYELVEMYRLTKPIDQTMAWMFTVARNKINDLYRRKKVDALEELSSSSNGEDEALSLFDILPDGSNQDPMMQETILEALSEALEELPAHQRLVFELHELEDKSFKEISAITGIKVSILTSEKRQAILFLREKLRYLYEDLFDI
jgi:RNA polymerase sigma factor (sigma-70 family)